MGERRDAETALANLKGLGFELECIGGYEINLRREDRRGPYLHIRYRRAKGVSDRVFAADQGDDGWWFLWLKNGHRITPVRHKQSAAERIDFYLRNRAAQRDDSTHSDAS